MENFREFRVGPDPFGRTWQVWFKWLQTAISIRHSDTVDVKFVLASDGERMERTISMPHLTLRELSRDMGVRFGDAWCARLAMQHLQRMILTAEDLEKDVIYPSVEDLRSYADAEKTWGAELVRKRRGAA